MGGREPRDGAASDPAARRCVNIRQARAVERGAEARIAGRRASWSWAPTRDADPRVPSLRSGRAGTAIPHRAGATMP